VPTAPSLRRSHFGRDFEGELGVPRPSEADIAAARANADETISIQAPPAPSVDRYSRPIEVERQHNDGPPATPPRHVHDYGLGRDAWFIRKGNVVTLTNSGGEPIKDASTTIPSKLRRTQV
jgi:hypothetical protein